MNKRPALWVPGKDDAAAYVALESRLHDYFAQFVGPSQRPFEPGEYRQFLFAQSPYRIVMSGARGDPSGFLRCHKFISDMYVDRLYVDELHRTQRLGSTFMSWAEGLASQLDCKRICLTVHTGNVDALAFYEHLGYRLLQGSSLTKKLGKPVA